MMITYLKIPQIGLIKWMCTTSMVFELYCWPVYMADIYFILLFFAQSFSFFSFLFQIRLHSHIVYVYMCVCIYREFRNMFNQPVHTIRVLSLLLHSSFSFEPREKETYHLTSINNYRLGSSTSFPSLLTKEKQKIMIETD